MSNGSQIRPLVPPPGRHPSSQAFFICGQLATMLPQNFYICQGFLDFTKLHSNEVASSVLPVDNISLAILSILEKAFYLFAIGGLASSLYPGRKRQAIGITSLIPAGQSSGIKSLMVTSIFRSRFKYLWVVAILLWPNSLLICVIGTPAS